MTETSSSVPLLQRLDKDNKQLMRDMEALDSAIAEEGGSPTFRPSLELAARGSFFNCLIAAFVWTAPMNVWMKENLSSSLVGYLPLTCLLYVFTLYPPFGTTVKNCYLGFVGTFWACFGIWFMNGLFPGGMKPGMSATSPVAIAGWVYAIGMVALMLICKANLVLKIYCLSFHVWFALEFLNPESKTPFSENFKLKLGGTAVNCMLATIIACSFAACAFLLPYPFMLAFPVAKKDAVSSSKDMSSMFNKAVQYYCGQEASVVIDAHIRHSKELRIKLDSMSAAISGAWWEGFDIGLRGTVRGLLSAHLEVMNVIFDQLLALQVAMSTEDFGDSHLKIMEQIGEPALKLSVTTGKLLVYLTEAAGDGDIDASEKANLKKQVSDCKIATKALSVAFHGARRSFGKPIHEELLQESFFCFTLSSYSRLVCEYGDILAENPPKGGTMTDAVVGGIKSTWSLSGMTERDHINMVIRSTIGTTIAFLYSKYVMNNAAGCVVTATLLINTRSGPDINANLNVLLGVLTSVVAASIIFEYGCMTGHGLYLIPSVSFLYVWATLYVYYNGGPMYSAIGMFLAAFGAMGLAKICPANGTFNHAGIYMVIAPTLMGAIIMALTEFILATDRASNLSINTFNEALTAAQESITAIWRSEDMTPHIEVIPGKLSACSSYGNIATKENRLWRNDWKSEMYDQLLTMTANLRLDLITLDHALGGSDGTPDALFGKFSGSKSLEGVQKDLEATLEDVRELAFDMLSHETGHFNPCDKLDSTSNLDVLDDLPKLMVDINAVMKFPNKAGDTLEDDELCQIAVVFVMLDSLIKRLAAMLQTMIRNS